MISPGCAVPGALPDELLELLELLALALVEAELILADLLQHDDPDIREAAACAMRLLRPERAAHWLTRRGRVEPDAAVRAAIEDELGRYHIGRT